MGSPAQVVKREKGDSQRSEEPAAAQLNRADRLPPMVKLLKVRGEFEV
jgi:hypothetical protein